MLYLFSVQPPSPVVILPYLVVVMVLGWGTRLRAFDVAAWVPAIGACTLLFAMLHFSVMGYHYSEYELIAATRHSAVATAALALLIPIWEVVRLFRPMPVGDEPAWRPLVAAILLALAVGGFACLVAAELDGKRGALLLSQRVWEGELLHRRAGRAIALADGAAWLILCATAMLVARDLWMRFRRRGEGVGA